MSLIVGVWLLLLVMLALAATVPPMPHKALLASIAVAWFVSGLAWSGSGAVDCWPGCTLWQDLIGASVIVIPALGILGYLALVVRDRVRKKNRSRLPF